MRIVIFRHPDWFHSISIDRFVSMIADGMRARGHKVEIWTAAPTAYRLPVPERLKKWMGYIDQFLLFPSELRRRLPHCDHDVLFVFADETLGPWVPLVRNRPHAIHNHGFFALRSSRGEFPGHRMAWSGRLYQRFIWKGFSRAKNFISISDQCRKDLHRYLPAIPELSEVVYNGLNYPFRPLSAEECREKLAENGLLHPEGRFLLHVGGNQFYKNRAGVLRIYKAYSQITADPLPLWMVGGKPAGDLLRIAGQIPKPGSVQFLTHLNNAGVHAAYASADALLFPSLWEGFGWPVAEAMACGCLVLTTNAAPMNLIGGDAATYWEPMPPGDDSGWALESARTLLRLLESSTTTKNRLRARGFQLVQRFSANAALDAYESIYSAIIASRTRES